MTEPYNGEDMVGMSCEDMLKQDEEMRESKRRKALTPEQIREEMAEEAQDAMSYYSHPLSTSEGVDK